MEVGVRDRIFCGQGFGKVVFRGEVFFNRAAVEGKGKLRVLVKTVVKWKGRRGGEVKVCGERRRCEVLTEQKGGRRG